MRIIRKRLEKLTTPISFQEEELSSSCTGKVSRSTDSEITVFRQDLKKNEPRKCFTYEFFMFDKRYLSFESAKQQSRRIDLENIENDTTKRCGCFVTSTINCNNLQKQRGVEKKKVKVPNRSIVE